MYQNDTNGLSGQPLVVFLSFEYLIGFALKMQHDDRICYSLNDVQDTDIYAVFPRNEKHLCGFHTVPNSNVFIHVNRSLVSFFAQQ